VNVPLAAYERVIGFLKNPASFLYRPVLQACATQVNQGMLFSRRIAEISMSRLYPLSCFKPTLKNRYQLVQFQMLLVI